MADAFEPLETERLILRRFEARDLEPFLAYRQDRDVAWFQGWSLDFTRQDAEAFIEEQSRVEPGALGTGAQIAIERKATGALVGDLFLWTPENQPKQAKIGYTLARGAWGEGLATEAVLGLLGWVFGTLGKHRVTAQTDTENERSIALLERVGMRREGHLRESWFHRERWTDEYVYALLVHEWDAR